MKRSPNEGPERNDGELDAALERWLGGRRGASDLSQRELDELLELARVDPSLPAGAAERLRVRLGVARELGADLDALLDVSPADAPPAGLASRAATFARREGGLDDLLEAVPAEAAPVGLAQRVLAHVADVERRTSMRRLRGVAVALAAGLLLWTGLRIGDRALELPSETMAGAELEARDLELLQHLELLEDWEEVTDPELLLGNLDPLDGLLLELDPEGAATAGAAEAGR